ncbi:HD domain-containing protein [Alteromonadaceae bacterium 2753L.S.0a.02]|nr:HD domain-containing protein [Alteromonadaceae bacterium 2753L.S.0a.02]
MMDEKLALMENYVRHLVAINCDYNVLVMEDILATNRQVIVPSGSRFSQSAATAIRGNNLIQPVGMNVFIAGTFTGGTLHKALSGYFHDDPVLCELYTKANDDSLLLGMCEQVCADKNLSQLLWVMKLRAPRVFERGAFCAWFAMILFSRQGKESERIYEAFLAGLIHDIGLLFLNHQVLAESTLLDCEIWEEMTQHPEIGYEILMYIPEVAQTVMRAVREHHEELDGTGYPAQKVGKQLAPLGRYLLLLESAHAIYSKYFRPRARTLHDLIPIIQMNHLNKPGQPAADLIILLRLGTATDSCSVPEELMPLLINQVRERHDYIKVFVEQADVFLEQNQLAIANARFFSFQSLLQHITVAMKQSGLINDGYIRWLDQVEKECLAHAYREVEDAFLMMQEILYHIRRFILRLQQFAEAVPAQKTQLTPIWAPEKTISLLENDGMADVTEAVKQSLLNFNRQEEPELPSELHQLWLTQVCELKRR